MKAGRWSARPRAAVPLEREPCSNAHDAHAIGGAHRLGFPLRADRREEIGSRRRIFGGDFVAQRTVITDRGSADEHWWRRCGVAYRVDDRPRDIQATVEDPRLVGVAPAACGNRFTGEVDDGAGAVDFLRPSCLRARKDDHLVAGGPERRGERTAEKAGAAGEDDAHRGRSVYAVRWPAASLE